MFELNLPCQRPRHHPGGPRARPRAHVGVASPVVVLEGGVADGGGAEAGVGQPDVAAEAQAGLVDVGHAFLEGKNVMVLSYSASALTQCW